MIDFDVPTNNIRICGEMLSDKSEILINNFAACSEILINKFTIRFK